MATGPDQQRLTPAERFNLVAYIDGELNEAESRVIATKLTKSPTARREVEALEKTWELLDQLPRPKVSEEFTARTLSEVQQLSLAGDRFESAVKRTAAHAGHVAAWVAASFVAIGVGYALMQWAWPNPTARLARDLSIAEHYDEYHDVGSFNFLEDLSRSTEFGTDHE
ncbi:anti-sigma factor family protein [Singulisphaera rosea]